MKVTMAISMVGLYLARAWGALVLLPLEAELLSLELYSIALPFLNYGHIDELDSGHERDHIVLRAGLCQSRDI